MNVEQKRKILQRIVAIEHDIQELQRCRSEIALKGYSSASMSSGGGSKSYTKLDLAKITELIMSLNSELKSLRKIMVGNSQALPQTIAVVYM